MTIEKHSAWYRIELSPHEWTWTQEEQVEMAKHVRRLYFKMNAYQKVVNAAKKVKGILFIGSGLKDLENALNELERKQ